jgi:hypothetical protein
MTTTRLDAIATRQRQDVVRDFLLAVMVAILLVFQAGSLVASLNHMGSSGTRTNIVPTAGTNQVEQGCEEGQVAADPTGATAGHPLC